MGVDIKAVFPSTDAATIATTLRRVYGGDNYTIRLTDEDRHMVISFEEELPADEKESNKRRHLLNRNRGKARMMHAFLDGMCLTDYRDLEIAGPTAYVMLGSSGEALDILTKLTKAMGGGFIRDEGAGDEWVKIDV